MLKASIVVVLVAYAAVFALTGVGEVEAAPTGLPDILGLGNIDKWVIDSAEELIDEIIKLIPENFDINNSILGAIKKILDQIPKDLS
uniref:Meichroacidin n=1 Tax=Coptotermes formosanus TaxID=36987 RepID=R4UM82_COPFO|nr:meichroacidin [Coptotermes formosanus]